MVDGWKGHGNYIYAVGLPLYKFITILEKQLRCMSKLWISGNPPNTAQETCFNKGPGHGNPDNMSFCDFHALLKMQKKKTILGLRIESKATSRTSLRNAEETWKSKHNLNWLPLHAFWTCSLSHSVLRWVVRYLCDSFFQEQCRYRTWRYDVRCSHIRPSQCHLVYTHTNTRTNLHIRNVAVFPWSINPNGTKRAWKLYIHLDKLYALVCPLPGLGNLITILNTEQDLLEEASVLWIQTLSVDECLLVNEAPQCT